MRTTNKNFNKPKAVLDKESIKVAIRIKPMSTDSMEAPCLEVNANKSIALSCGKKHFSFPFDTIFDQAASQADIFNSIGAGMVDSVLDGFNTCLFAYGQTGSGKTFTMSGLPGLHEEQRGLIPRVIQHLFEKLRCQNITDPIHEEDTASSSPSCDINYSCACSLVEIHNERIYDLLVDRHLLQTDAKGRPILEDLKCRQTEHGGVTLSPLTSVPVADPAAALALLEKGNALRATAQTDMNATSSRSHSVCMLQITQSLPDPTDITTPAVSVSTGNESFPFSSAGKADRERGRRRLVRVSTLNLVDLAGSENQKLTHTVGARLREAGQINKSLSALGNVIQALVAGDPHVPYRNSKLTLLLRDSLGGSARTVLLAAVNPTPLCAPETLSTLLFAQRATLVVNAVKKTRGKLALLDLTHRQDEAGITSGSLKTSGESLEEREHHAREVSALRLEVERLRGLLQARGLPHALADCGLSQSLTDPLAELPRQQACETGEPSSTDNADPSNRFDLQATSTHMRPKSPGAPELPSGQICGMHSVAEATADPRARTRTLEVNFGEDKTSSAYRALPIGFRRALRVLLRQHQAIHRRQPQRRRPRSQPTCRDTFDDFDMEYESTSRQNVSHTIPITSPTVRNPPPAYENAIIGLHSPPAFIRASQWNEKVVELPLPENSGLTDSLPAHFDKFLVYFPQRERRDEGEGPMNRLGIVPTRKTPEQTTLGEVGGTMELSPAAEDLSSVGEDAQPPKLPTPANSTSTATNRSNSNLNATPTTSLALGPTTVKNFPTGAKNELQHSHLNNGGVNVENAAGFTAPGVEVVEDIFADPGYPVDSVDPLVVPNDIFADPWFCFPGDVDIIPGRNGGMAGDRSGSGYANHSDNTDGPAIPEDTDYYPIDTDPIDIEDFPAIDTEDFPEEDMFVSTDDENGRSRLPIDPEVQGERFTTSADLSLTRTAACKPLHSSPPHARKRRRLHHPSTTPITTSTSTSTGSTSADPFSEALWGGCVA